MGNSNGIERKDQRRKRVEFMKSPVGVGRVFPFLPVKPNLTELI
jgi:hypothetical protein